MLKLLEIGREYLLVCMTSRLQHFLDKRFTDGVDISPLLSEKTPGTHFC
jgi:hypothetical protein